MKTVAENDRLEFITEVPYSNREKMIVHEKKTLDQRAAFAQDMIRAWGMVAARPADDAEMCDTRKLTLQAPAEVVARACEVTEIAFAEFEKRGWVLIIPKFQEINKISDD